MKSVLHYIYMSLALAATMNVAGCTRPQDKLDAASRLTGERPDSAYTILRDIDYDDLYEDSLRAKYVLTKAMTNIRVGRSLITDTLLSDAATYYLSAGDTANWVIASQLLSGYDFIKGDTQSALHRLEDMLPKIKNPELLWDTHIHLLELSINSNNYAGASNYADWLLRHTDVPEQILKFAIAKSASLYYMEGHAGESLAVLDSIIATGVTAKVPDDVAREFYSEYVEILDGAGHSSRAIEIIDSLYHGKAPANESEKINLIFSLAQFHANAGNTKRALQLLDSINLDGTQSYFEIYASVAMLKAALQLKESGRFPSELMHKVTKNIQRNYLLSQFDRQTAMESVIELGDDNYKLKLQRQRLWLIISVISLLLVVSGIAVYFVMAYRKRRMIEAEERAETLSGMLKELEKTEKRDDGASDSDKLKAVLLRQLGIFKTFAGTPTPQSRDALRKISSAGNNGASIESLIDWPDFYSMIDSLYDGFHAKLLKKYPGTFNDKEQQIIVLLKAGFSTKEIGVLTEQSSATIYTRKSVIRKKLATPENGDIIARLDAGNKAL